MMIAATRTPSAILRHSVGEERRIAAAASLVAAAAFGTPANGVARPVFGGSSTVNRDWSTRLPGPTNRGKVALEGLLLRRTNMLTCKHRMFAGAVGALLVSAYGCSASPDTGWINLLEGRPPIGDHLKVYTGAPEAWTIGPDGVLAVQGGPGGWIGTKAGDFGDFHLKLDFNVAKDGNSGVFIRRPIEGDGAYTGMEIQVIDDDATRFGKLQPWQACGSIYHEVAPSVRATRPAGTWQTMEIIARGPIVQVRINGVQIVHANLEEYTTTTAAKAAPLKDRPRAGHIGFQNYDGRGIAYRNVRIKRLSQ